MLFCNNTYRCCSKYWYQSRLLDNLPESSESLIYIVRFDPIVGNYEVFSAIVKIVK